MRAATSTQVISSLEVSSKSSIPRPCNADMVFVWSQPKYGLDLDTYIQVIFGVSQVSTVLCLGRGLELGWLSQCHPALPSHVPRQVFLPLLPAAGIWPGTTWIQNEILEESASAAMTSNCPTSGSEDLIPGLAKTVKRLAGSNVQIISCYSVLGPTLWYANFQSPEKYVWA